MTPFHLDNHRSFLTAELATLFYMQPQLHFLLIMLYVSLQVSAELKLQFAIPGLVHLLLPVGASHLAPAGIGPEPFIGMMFVIVETRVPGCGK